MSYDSRVGMRWNDVYVPHERRCCRLQLGWSESVRQLVPRYKVAQRTFYKADLGSQATQ